jgi:hypothetical protein
MTRNGEAGREAGRRRVLRELGIFVRRRYRAARGHPRLQPTVYVAVRGADVIWQDVVASKV